MRTRHWFWPLLAATLTMGPSLPAAERVHISDFLPDRSVARAGTGRSVTLRASVANLTQTAVALEITLEPPDGIRLAAGTPSNPLRQSFAPGEERDLQWKLHAEQAAYGLVKLSVRENNTLLAQATVPLRFLAPLPTQAARVIPAPHPVPTPLLIGAHHCPLWEADQPEMWTQIRKHMERVPALGFYAQDHPEIADWETLWAVEHGISFFIYCWYRTSQGGPVQTRFSSAIHDALFQSRHADKLRFTIMWENQARGQAGVADEEDLMRNLLPYWITNYFQHPSYLKLDNQPLLFIYRPEFLVQDLGGIDQVQQAFAKMRQACREVGFNGLYLLGEYRGTDPNHLTLMKNLGLDYTFAYVWYVGNHPTPAEAIAAQMNYLHRTQQLGILPQVATVSQGWTGWRDEGTIWHLPPPDYESLLRQAQEFVATMPTNQLGHRLLLLDNWNEWGEGHYIAPYTEYGFGYLDAIRHVFAPEAGPHLDLIPEDVALGPYDAAYRQHVSRARESRRQISRHITKPGAPEAHLLGWWAFDEPDSRFPVTFDYSGNRHGGQLHHTRRADGLDGPALVCDGGVVQIASHPSLSPANRLTLACWVRTDLPGQDNKWFVNRVLAGGTDTGYRLGVLQGKPCFEIPQTSWSHHLSAEVDLPAGPWVHVAGTFDGRVMRIYVDGRASGSLERPGPIRPNDLPLCLGGYDLNHPAHFTGLLDEVRLYDRALAPAEIAQLAQRPIGGQANRVPGM